MQSQHHKSMRTAVLARGLALLAALFILSPAGASFAQSAQEQNATPSPGVKPLQEAKQGHENPDTPEFQEKEAKKNQKALHPENGPSASTPAKSEKQRKELGQKTQEKKKLKNESYRRYSGTGR